MSKAFNLDFLEDREIEIVIDLGKNNLKYVCDHLTTRCQVFTKEGSKEFAKRFNEKPENRKKNIKLMNIIPHIKEFPKDFADLIVVKNIDFNTREIFRVLKKGGIVIIYFPITKNFDDAPYLKKIQSFFKEVGYSDQYLYKNQDLDDGLFNILVAMK